MQPNASFQRLNGMHATYRFRIQPLFGRTEPCFQLTVGMAEDRDFELIPAHRAAFAQRFGLREFHSSQAEVQLELTSLLEWLAARSPATPRLAAN